MAKSFWQLIEDKICPECGFAVIKIDDECYFCPHCKASLSLCGNYGKCEGIRYDWPMTLQDGQLIEEPQRRPCDGNFWCDTCGTGGEWM